MTYDESKTLLSVQDAAKAQKIQAEAADALLDPDNPKENLVGVGLGIKWTDGEPTGKPALVALVKQKVAKEDLTPADLIPAKFKEMPTDVLAVGEPFAGQAEPEEFEALALANRVRPASGGYSVGHVAITAGTLGTCVYDQVGAPGDPVGIPNRYYILSNNHVMADSNNASPGDAILQPGPADGGRFPQDRIASLSRFIRITFDTPQTPLRRHRNLVDAAIAAGEFDDLKREIHWVGHLTGWLPRSQIHVGMQVQKCGRTTNFSTGRITAVNATLDINYRQGRVARFRDQIITTAMSAPGDSGSMIATRDNKAVGLLFAGSSAATIANQIQHVRSLLRIEIV